MKLKISIVVLVALSVNLNGSTTDGTQILYSINMPGNPFQQPYYQMMIKADNENRVYPFSAANNVQLYTANACYFEPHCGSGLNVTTLATSDYVSLYADIQGASTEVSVMYGLSPYVFRGYVEGAASKLYLQRPAQVQLPFNPLAQMNQSEGGATSYVNATLPDYSDVFLAQTVANVYKSLNCSSNICTFESTNTPLPSWYAYIPRAGWLTKAFSTIFYGTINSLAQSNKPQTTFSLYDEMAPGWGKIITLGVSKMSATGVPPSTASLLADGVFSKKSILFGGVVPGHIGEQTFDNFSFVIFAPIVSPGYAGDAQQFPQLAAAANNPVNPLQTVLASGDLAGNYSVENTKNSYIDKHASATTYDGVTLNNGMSYFQLFAQNMQWFTQTTNVVPYGYSLPSLATSPNGNPAKSLSTTLQNVTPGQGIFSDAIQIAAMQAPVGVSKMPVFTGSLGQTAGITGPIMLIGAAPLVTGAASNFTVPQAFLSELTVDSFKVGRYLQAPLATQMNGTWSGGLVQSASEDPLQYYQGIVSSGTDISSSMMPYLPIYFSDPGRDIAKEFKPGWSYCPKKLFTSPTNSQMRYDTATSPMANFYAALNGTR